MEPQRYNSYAESEPARFVGSFERFDLYLAAFSSGRCWVRVAWDSGTEDYESYPIEGRRVKFEPVWEVKNSPPAQKDLILIEHYLSLFVPELGIKSRYMERITDGT